VRCFAEFGLGMILFQRRSMFSIVFHDIAVLLFAAGIIAGVVLRWDLLVVAIMIPMLPALAANTGACSRTLSHGVFREMGVISYSIYLIQLPMIQVIDRLAKGSFLAAEIHWIIAPLAILLLAACTYRFIEKPANRWVRSLSGSFRSRVTRP